MRARMIMPASACGHARFISTCVHVRMWTCMYVLRVRRTSLYTCTTRAHVPYLFTYSSVQICVERVLQQHCSLFFTPLLLGLRSG